MTTIGWQHTHTAPGDNPVLDIGGEVGALIVYLAAQPATGELEACPTSSPVEPAHRVDTGSGSFACAPTQNKYRFHTGVHHRTVGGVGTWVAIFPEVVEGAYYLLDDDGFPMAQVSVTGGEVQEVDVR